MYSTSTLYCKFQQTMNYSIRSSRGSDANRTGELGICASIPYVYMYVTELIIYVHVYMFTAVLIKKHMLCNVAPQQFYDTVHRYSGEESNAWSREST